MDELRKYIIENKEQLEDETIPQGDFARFGQRLSEFGIHPDDSEIAADENIPNEVRRIQFRRNVSSARRSKPFWRVALIPVAASIALIMMIRISIAPLIQQSADSQAIVADSNTAAEAYCRHVENVAELSRSIALLTIDMSELQAKYVASVVENITRENVPIIDLLPKELSEERKIHIINDYSNRQIDALLAYKTKLENNL